MNVEQHPHLTLVVQSPATIEEAAKFLKVSRGSIYNLLNAGELVSIKLPGLRATRIPWPAIHDLARRSLVGPVDETLQRIHDAESSTDAPDVRVAGE